MFSNELNSLTVDNYDINYKDLYIPLLNQANIQPIPTEQVIHKLAADLKVPQRYLYQHTACGRQFKFNNKVIIARTYLAKLGYIQVSNTKDKTITITAKGKNLLHKKNNVFKNKLHRLDQMKHPSIKKC